MKKSFTAIHLCGKAHFTLMFLKKDRQDSKKTQLLRKNISKQFL